MGLSEAQLLLVTSILLPGIVILIVAFFSGCFERAESAKYMAVVPDELPWEREPGEDEPVSRGRRRKAERRAAS